MKLSVLMRKCHRWGAIIVALPFVIVIVTGLMLQTKKQWAWVQPPELRGASGAPTVSMEMILSACQAVPDAHISSWGDIDRIDLRPSKGMLKVKAINNTEIQIDARTGAVLQVAYRRSDIIESLHDGSWFAGWTKLGLFLPMGIVVFGLWCSGLYLFVHPKWILRRRRTKR